MAKVGYHNNIVNLQAVSQNPTTGQFYLILEYCHYGSLKKFLIKGKNIFIDTIEKGDIKSTYGLITLLSWASEVNITLFKSNLSK